MSNISVVKLNTTSSLVFNASNYLLQLDFPPKIRLTRHLLHLIIFIFFLLILAFVGHKRSYPRTSTRPFSHLSRFIVSIAILGLILADLLVINGVTHRIWCSIHQIVLHFLLMTITAGCLLSDFYEYASRYYHQRPSGTLKSGVIVGFVILLGVQFLMSIMWMWTNHSSPNDVWSPPILCPGSFRPQLLILLLHLLDLIFTIQSLRTSMTLDNNSLVLSMNEIFCHLNSILLRLFYFTGTSILHALFLPGQFSATFYGGILVIELVLKYLIVLHHSNVKHERNTGGIDDTAYLRLKNENLSDDTRLLNGID